MTYEDFKQAIKEGLFTRKELAMTDPKDAPRQGGQETTPSLSNESQAAGPAAGAPDAGETPETDDPDNGYRAHYAEHEHNRELCRSLERSRNALAARVETLEQEAENERLKLAACGVAAMQNTRKSAATHRLPADSPYRCASYDEVCAAVDREMDYRERAESAESRLAALEREKEDAERYRWLRENPETEDIWGRMGKELDKAIDAALSAKGGKDDA